MDLNCLVIESNNNFKFVKNSKGHDIEKFIIEKIILENRFYCLKVKKTKDPESFGISDDDDEVPLTKVIGDKKLLDIGFVIIDINTNRVYFDCKQWVVKDIIKNFSDVQDFKLNTEISYDDLKFLTGIKIVKKANGNISLDEIDEFSYSDDILDLAKFSDFEQISTYLKFKGKTSKDLISAPLEKLIKRNLTGSQRLIIEGLDDSNNKIIYNESLKFKKRIHLPIELKNWDEKRNYKLNELLVLLKQKEKLL